MDVITCHVNADFDCLSSMVGIKKLYTSAVLVFPGSQEKKVRDFLQVYPVDIKRMKDIDFNNVERLIIVDTKKPDRIGTFHDVLNEHKDIKVYIYDHHPFTDGDIRGSLEVIEDVGATATIITEILQERNIELDPMEATMLCLGIYEETGSMRFPSTTERDLIAVSYLLKRGANLNIISEFTKAEISRDELDMLNELVDSARNIVIEGVRISVCRAVREEYLGDVAHLAHRIIDMEEIDGLVLVLGMEGKVVLIGRSRVPEFNVAELMSRFGGGGHPVAASATLREEPLELLEERIFREIRSVVRPIKIAADIMTQPVISIQWNATMKEAGAKLTRYDVNVLPVLRDEKYKGLISRENVEKALFHGFRKSRVMDFMTTDATAAPPDMSIRDVEVQMIEKNQRFMPVIQDERIIGAITRTDLLRSLYEDFLKRSRIEKEEYTERPSVGRNVTSMMKERFPDYLGTILQKAGETAEESGYVAYLVGGCVRDMLMGTTNLDIDIVIEGNGIEFARQLVTHYDARLKTHERFGTAKIVFMPSGDINSAMNIDIATARTEYYEEPAALPKVETSSIKKDLYRRDFTINTLAICLNPERYGGLIDFFGGQRDIRDRVVRVLHNLSFVEDPTRAFRAVRFAERFGFRISKHTENLIKSALKLNLFDKLSGSRLYDELLLTFNETEPVIALKQLAKYNLLSVIHPNLTVTPVLEEALNDVHETLAWYALLFMGDQPNRAQIYLMALLTELNEDEIGSSLTRLSTPVREKERMLMRINNTRQRLRDIVRDDPVVIYRVLHDLDLETILYMMAICKEKTGQRAISRYLVEMRNVAPLIKGDDLKKLAIPPGPLYSEILHTVLEEKLKGKLASKKEEIEFVKRHYTVRKKKEGVVKKTAKAKVKKVKGRAKSKSGTKVKKQSTVKKKRKVRSSTS